MIRKFVEMCKGVPSGNDGGGRESLIAAGGNGGPLTEITCVLEGLEESEAEEWDEEGVFGRLRQEPLRDG